MPKVILEYNLPEEQENYETAMNGGHNYSLLWDISMYARSLRKYEEREMLPREEVLEKLHELLEGFEE